MSPTPGPTPVPCQHLELMARGSGKARRAGLMVMAAAPGGVSRGDLPGCV